jgi:hypothetical protein
MVGVVGSAAALAVLSVMGVVGLTRAAGPWGAALVVCGVLGFWAVAALVTYVAGRPIILPRTMIAAAAPWTIVLGAAPLAFRSRAGRTFALAATAGLAVAGAVRHATLPPPHDRSYREIVAIVAGSDAPRAPVAVVPNSSALPLAYYDARLGADLLLAPLPEAYPALGRELRYPAGGGGVAAVTPAAVAALLSTLDGDLWVVSRLESLFDDGAVLRGSLLAGGWRPETLRPGGGDRVALTRWRHP